MRTSSGSAIETELRRIPTASTGGWLPVVGLSYYTSGAPHDGAGDWTYFHAQGGKARIIDVRASIEPYSQTCTITLDNSEGTFDSLAATYKGKWLQITFGFTIGGEGKYPAQKQPYFYCTGYTFSSDIVGGRAIDVLKLYGEGVWNRLGRLMAVPDLTTPADGAPYYYNQPTMDATRDGMDADDIFSQLCDMAGIAKSTLGSWSDYVTSWEPKLTFDFETTVSGHVGPTADIAAMLLLQPFRVRAVPRADYLYLTIPGTTTNWTFKLAETADPNFQQFSGGSFTSSEALPGKVAVVNGSYGATYGTSSMGGYNYALAEAWGIGTSNAYCSWIAQSIVELIQEQQDSGVIDVPILNPLLELYDYITVIDGRGNISTTTGRVGGLSYQYTPSMGIYSMRVRLGGVWGLPEGVAELTGGRPEPTKGTGSTTGTTGSGSSSSGSSSYSNRSSASTAAMSGNLAATSITAGQLFIGDLVTGDLTDLDSANYSDLDGTPTSLSDISASEATVLTYAGAALDSSGRLKTYVYGPGLQDLSMTGKVAGLYMTKSKMGYWNGSSWNTYFDNAGSGYFRGTIYASAIATGSTLTVGGNIDVITDGGSYAGIRLGTHTINGSIYTGMDIFGSCCNFWDDNNVRRGMIVGYSNYFMVQAYYNTNLLLTAGTGNVYITGGAGRDIILSVSSGGRVKIMNLPSSDPHEIGAMYFDAGTGILYGSQG